MRVCICVESQAGMMLTLPDVPHTVLADGTAGEGDRAEGGEGVEERGVEERGAEGGEGGEEGLRFKVPMSSDVDEDIHVTEVDGEIVEEVCARERERTCVCVSEREGTCVKESERAREAGCEREREKERARE